MPKDLFAEIDNQPVRQPKDLFNENKPKNWVDKIVSNDAFQALLGAGDSSRNFISNSLNLLPGFNIKPVQSGEGTAYKIGEFAGDIGTFFAGGEALDAGRAAAEVLPYIGKLATSLGKGGLTGLAKKTLGGGAYGAIANPEDRESGAIVGATGGAFSELPGLSIKAVKAISPKKSMSNAFNLIGNRSLETSLQSDSMYKNIFNQYGKLPVVTKNLEEDVFKNVKLKKLYNKYKEDPSLLNAHKLQSQLGSSRSSLKAADTATHDAKYAYQEEQQKLQDSIASSLKSTDQTAYNLYDEATRHYKTQVLPYKMLNKAINRIPEPTPKKVLTKISDVTKRDSYPKINFGKTEEPIIPEDIESLSKALRSTMKNKKLATTGAKIGAGALLTAGALSNPVHTLKKLLEGGFK